MLLTYKSAPKYYYELKDHTTGRFNVVVNISFFCAGLTYMMISSLGFFSPLVRIHPALYSGQLFLPRSLGVLITTRSGTVCHLLAYPLLFLGVSRDGWIALSSSSTGTTESPTLRRRGTTLLLLTIYRHNFWQFSVPGSDIICTLPSVAPHCRHVSLFTSFSTAHVLSALWSWIAPASVRTFVQLGNQGIASHVMVGRRLGKSVVPSWLSFGPSFNQMPLIVPIVSSLNTN